MVSKPPAARGKPETSAEASTKEPSKHTQNPRCCTSFFWPVKNYKIKIFIEEVKAVVYCISGLGQMHGVWGLHKRLSGEVF